MLEVKPGRRRINWPRGELQKLFELHLEKNLFLLRGGGVQPDETQTGLLES